MLTGLSMRTAATSVGPVLDDLRGDLRISSVVAGLLTTLPVVCFAGLGALTPRAARRWGQHRLLAGSMATMTAGLLARALTSSFVPFAAASVLALSGGAVANVLMPSLVKRHFPGRIGAMTAAYTTALAVGATLAVGLTVPISEFAGGPSGWRLGLGSWAVLSAMAVVPWLALVRDEGPGQHDPTAPSRRRLTHSRTAWALMFFFAGQSFQAYVAFGWFPTFLRDHGMSAERAGLLVAFYSALSIPTSIVMPLLAIRGQRPLVLGLGACYLAGYVGLLVAPVGGAWLWMVLVACGSGMFPLALTMIGLRTRDGGTTQAVSAFVQTFGYVLAGTGPLLVGLLLDLTGGWAWSFVPLFVVLGLTVTAGWFAARPGVVDDEIGELDGGPR